MASQLDANVKDDLKTQFVTREGTYRLLTLSEYSRPNRVGYSSNQSSPQVRVSIVTLPNPAHGSSTNAGNSNSNSNSNGNKSNNEPAAASGASPTAAAAAATTTTTTTSGNRGTNSNGASTATPAASTSNTTTPTTSTSGGAGGGGGNISNGGAGGDNNYNNSNSTVDARLGGGISMHSMMNGGVTDQNGMASSQVVGGDRICFNFGRDLYVYSFRGAKKGTEMSKPIDKKFYKGTNPSCHDFNSNSATPTGAPLLVGFTTGQIQLVSPQMGPRELRKLFNEERLIDKTKVTCLKWLPNSPHLFLASHSSGHLYLYNEELPCAATAPNYQPFKMGDGYTILTCKSKSTRNPLYKWAFSTDNCCINEFCFSPCGSNLAVVSQDGFLRVFHYDTMELLGIARSYFGGFLCVCWSPDGKYIVVGGEDDLVTVWSLQERRVVARGQGHRSWVSVVAFDPYTTSYTNWDGGDFSDDENQLNEQYTASREARFSGDSTANGGFEGFDRNSTPVHAARPRPHSASFRSDASSAALAPDKLAISYRLGSVSQDTQVCLWDITEDVLRHPLALRQRVNSTQLNDTSFLNGGIDADGIKVIRPIAIGHGAGGNGNGGGGGGGNHAADLDSCSPTRETAGGGGATENSNSSSSKFSTANCTISSQSSNANTPPEDCETEAATPASTSSNAAATTPAAAAAVAPAAAAPSTKQNSRTHGTSNSIKFPNCISATKSDSIDGNASASGSGGQRTSYATSGYNSKTSNSSTKSSNSGSGFSAFNSLTQRLSNLNFLSNSDKKSSSSVGHEGSNSTAHRQHRKAMSMLKSYNQHNNHSSNNHSNNSSSSNFGHSSNQESGVAIGSSSTAHSFGSLKLSKSSHNASSLVTGAQSAATVSSFDPMKLIGTPACPRFDECPLLEPLVCKKIAHERLTALIFREDCFLTACQDGFIYTWARPGHATHTNQQHLSPSQSAAPGGTVI
ncbi:WD repeat-containing protein 20 [Drosophila pseudoobscura]|uniref:WD repeat-containing protein 20 n=1 Tax=Drosophila pseudoobscura pseudoobscura TaxID=46245 RepID=A0A6I8VZ39_DROPS|nr:WD repeat-containing protein 20 [Drosophila pseudoobscura]